jgi:reactive intermediate/imine deaminase
MVKHAQKKHNSYLVKETQMKQPIRVEDAPTPGGPYSQGIIAGPFVFVAGQGPADPATRQVPEGIEAQTHQTLRNVAAILRGAGCSMDDVVKVTAHLADLDDFAAYNRVYEQHFSEPRPVRTTVGSQLNKILVEIDVIAYRDRPADFEPTS